MQVAIAAMLSSAWPKPAPSSVSPSGTTSPTGSKSPISLPSPASRPSSNIAARQPDRPHFCPSYGDQCDSCPLGHSCLASTARYTQVSNRLIRQNELLPVPYFHVVFTVPAPVAEIAFQNKATVY